MGFPGTIGQSNYCPITLSQEEVDALGKAYFDALSKSWAGDYVMTFPSSEEPMTGPYGQSPEGHDAELQIAEDWGNEILKKELQDLEKQLPEARKAKVEAIKTVDLINLRIRSVKTKLQAYRP